MAVLGIVFLVTLLLGVPIAFVLGISSLVYVLFVGGFDGILVPQRMFVGADSFTLMAIPFFILAGGLMNSSDITRRILVLCQCLVGHIKGGLAHVNVLASMFFGGITGAAVADVSAIGKILIPAMEQDEYDRDFSAAITAASSCMGPIIPPSIPLVIYGVSGEVSIKALFLAGVIPGIMLGLSQMGLVAYYARKRNYRAGVRASFKKLVDGFKEAIWAIIMPLIIMGGIIFGIFTPTEAGAIAVFYAFFVGMFVFKTLKISDLPNILYETALLTASVMLMISFASAFAWILAAERIPQTIAAGMLSFTTNPIIMLLLINILLLIVGTFLDTTGALIILTPVLLPIVIQMGVDPVHFGMIMVFNLIIGLITPPVGLVLFVTSAVGNISLERLTVAIIPFIFLAIAVLLLITYIPAISLFLPSVF